MELYLFRPDEHKKLYGCANITVEDVSLDKRQHFVKGIITIVLSAVYYRDVTSSVMHEMKKCIRTSSSGQQKHIGDQQGYPQPTEVELSHRRLRLKAKMKICARQSAEEKFLTSA
uniref:Uncharacterized protein n=1 Tax=Ditylenchus dipsaci TaxID=166011 RepID=A0A915E227_9BILA